MVELAGDRATGMQHFVFIDQRTHGMRLGWYREYVRTTSVIQSSGGKIEGLLEALRNKTITADTTGAQ